MRNNPYRDSVDPVRRVGSTGIVDDMVRQFADPYAFVRELVQNAIDASASAIQVEVRLDGGETVRTSVTDDGCGMSRQDIESRLLTLFASSKENVEGKIGKYGIGFLSVLGVEPEQVLIETWQEDASYLVRLHCDFQYILERGLPREGSGTRVTLVSTMNATSFKSHCQKVRAALLGWCRHASVPIFFEAHGSEQPSSKVCVNEPFDLMAPVKVQFAQGEESLVVGYQAGCSLLPGAAASPEGDASFAGFYNHGLTLFETTEVTQSGLEGIRFKVMSPRLRHTLSRDNVRRDDAYARMLDAVHSLASNQLVAELRKRNAEAANSIAAAGWGPEDTAVMVAAATHLSANDVVLPLLHPIDGRRSLSVAEIHRLHASKQPCLLAGTEDELSTALAARKAVVLRGAPQAVELLGRVLRPRALLAPTAVYFLAHVIPARDQQALAFAERLKNVLRAAGHELHRIAFVAGHELFSTRCSIVGDADVQGAFVAERSSLSRLPSAKAWRTGTLLLNADDPTVRFAIQQEGRGMGELSASLFARIILLENSGAIASEANEELLLASLNAAARLDEGARR